jgi:DNA-binding response OmpR family regulator
MHRVLLADDARLLVELEQTALGRSSWELVTVRPHDDMVEVAEQIQPSAIVLIDGEACPDALDLCRRLRRSPSIAEVPVVYVGLGLERQRYVEAGVTVFVPRPVRRHDLREAMRKCLPIRERTALRRKVSLPITLTSGARTWTGRVIDLSLTGTRVQLDAPIEPGTVTEATFEAGDRQLTLRASVVREAIELAETAAYGLRFERIDAPTAVFLSRYVRNVGERRGAGHANESVGSGSP